MKFSLSQLLQSTAWLGVAFALVTQLFTFPFDTRGNALHEIETLRMLGAFSAGVPIGLAIGSLHGHTQSWCAVCSFVWPTLLMIILFLSGV